MYFVINDARFWLFWSPDLTEEKIFLPRNVPDTHIQPDSEMKMHHAINFRVVEILWKAKANRSQLFSAGEMRLVPLR